MFATTHFPDYREIDAPWEPQEIQWRQKLLHGQHVHNKTALEKYVAKPHHTHVVREVQALIYDQPPITKVSEAREIFQLVDEQFATLRDTTGLQVASTEWHAFKDTTDALRVLARVEIIDGTKDFSLEQDEALLDEINRYERRNGGLILADLLRSQFIYGSPRVSKDMSQSAFFLVDIEPLLKRTA